MWLFKNKAKSWTVRANFFVLKHSMWTVSCICFSVFWFLHVVELETLSVKLATACLLTDVKSESCLKVCFMSDQSVKAYSQSAMFITGGDSQHTTWLPTGV